eukprot:3614348-Rhodomonas_salina.2
MKASGFEVQGLPREDEVGAGVSKERKEADADEGRERGGEEEERAEAPRACGEESADSQCDVALILDLFDARLVWCAVELAVFCWCSRCCSSCEAPHAYHYHHHHHHHHHHHPVILHDRDRLQTASTKHLQLMRL